MQYKVTCRKEEQDVQLKGNILVRSCNPGVKNPLAVYSLDGTTLDFGNNPDSDRLQDLREKANKFQGWQLCKTGVDPAKPHFVFSSAKCRQFHRKECQLHKKHAHLVVDFHCCASNYLALTLDVIVMPRLETSRMVCSKLASVTKQDLLAWSHCKFLNNLVVKCHDVAHNACYKKASVLLVQPEAYMSKMCSKCSHIHKKLSSNKMFKCPNCKYQANRNHNGAFSMILKDVW